MKTEAKSKEFKEWKIQKQQQLRPDESLEKKRVETESKERRKKNTQHINMLEKYNNGGGGLLRLSLTFAIQTTNCFAAPHSS